MDKYILIIVLLGSGGSSPRPAVAMETIEFGGKQECEVALGIVEKMYLPTHTKYGPKFTISAKCLARWSN